MLLQSASVKTQDMSNRRWHGVQYGREWTECCSHSRVHNSQEREKQVGKITSGERGKSITILWAFNVSGSYIPPMTIFPRVNMTEQLPRGAPLGTIGAASKTGWTDSKLFLKWLHHFVAFVKPTQQRNAILLLDGHASHKSVQAIEYARENGIVMICFPPHKTHRLQALDLGIFWPVKTYYNAACLFEQSLFWN